MLSVSRPIDEVVLKDCVTLTKVDEQRARREYREAERKRQWEADRRRYELEQQGKRETIRFRRLVQQADDRRTAAEIRALVAAVRAKRDGAIAEDAAEFERWSRWALAQADRIDPLLSDALFDLRVSDEELYAFGTEAQPAVDRYHRPSVWGGWRWR